jgi:hypothetical protein
MGIKITQDAGTPTASIELMITVPLSDYDLHEIAAPVPRDVDPILASQGFKDLLDEVRATLDRELSGSNLELTQLTGAISHDQTVYHPGIWVVLRERDAAKDAKEMSTAARQRITAIADTLRTTFHLS